MSKRNDVASKYEYYDYFLILTNLLLVKEFLLMNEIYFNGLLQPQTQEQKDAVISLELGKSLGVFCLFLKIRSRIKQEVSQFSLPWRSVLARLILPLGPAVIFTLESRTRKIIKYETTLLQISPEI